MNAAFREAFASLQSATGEDDVRDALHDALRALGTERFTLEYALPSGRVDMAAPERRVLIETKARGAVGPRRPGAGAEETQKEQVERYLREARAAWLGDLFQQLHRDPEDEPRIFLTDGLKWWGYEIDATGSVHAIAAGVATRNDQEAAAFLRQHVVPAQRRYKPSVPDDLIGELLSDFANDLNAIYRSQEGSAGVQTKIALWRESLRGAGIVPPDDEPVGQANLFVRHTVLVVAARTLKMLLRGTRAAGAGPLHDEIAEGFTAWLAESREGAATIDRIAAKLDEYRWRGHTRDRLKDAYHKLIAKDERKEFGEYYTPDWLAQKVVDETLDEAWMEAAVQAASRGGRATPLDGHTVLDPACGSGTFLFHAARRLHGYLSRRHPRKLHQARRIVVRMVVGIDVHPIAVEMAEATLEMALPPPSSVEDGELVPQVFLGDAMQSTRRDDLSSDLIVTTSARGSNLTIPAALAIHPDADALTARLVAAAVDGEQVEFPELIDSADREAMVDTLNRLARIVKAESNHVWVWHLRNISGPVRMARTKAGRIVANPPWLMANDTPEGTRKRYIAQMRGEYGLRNPALAGTSTEGDLAAVFATRVAHLYLAAGGKMGLVLPGGVLINQNWAPWRSGCWHSPENPGCHMNMVRAWGMDDLRPPPFAHAPSGSCVVFCERRGDGSACQPARTGLKNKDVGLWSGSPDDPTVLPKRSMPAEESGYLGDWRIGALSKPHGLFYVMAQDVTTLSETTRGIRTKESTRAPWRGISLEAEVEAAALRPLARPQTLRAFSITPDAFLIVPAVRRGRAWRLVDDVQDTQFGADLPLTLAYWKRAGQVFGERRTEGAGATLLDNLNYRNTLSAQLESGGWAVRGSRSRTKVVYNESGDTLKAARCSPSVVANQSLYWLNAATEEEALYLCGIINAPCMAGAWRLSKTSRMHFDKSPWRQVPVPKFNANDRKHREVVAAARHSEEAATVASAATAAEVRDDSLPHQLDAAVESLLPRYADL